MKRSYVKRLALGTVFSVLIFGVCGHAAAQGSKVLDKETRLNPTASGNPAIYLKAGTSVALDAKGYVLSGTLSKDAFLNVRSLGSPACHFKAGTQIWFDEKGRVQHGTLSRDAYLNVPSGGNPACFFKAGAQIWFDEKGRVVHGTLGNDAYLNVPSLGNPACLFKAGTPIWFDHNGRAFHGTLSRNAYLDRVKGSAATFLGGTEISFDPKGKVVSGTLAPLDTPPPAPFGPAVAEGSIADGPMAEVPLASQSPTEGSTAEDPAADEPPGSWLLTNGTVQHAITEWSPKESLEIFSPMKVDIKDGVMTADYTGPYSYSFGGIGGMSGTVTTSMHGTYDPKTGLSGTFNLRTQGTHDYGFNGIVKPTSVVRNCTFANPQKLEHGVPYTITLSCSGESKPPVIKFNVAMIDAAKEEKPAEDITYGEMHINLSGYDANDPNWAILCGAEARCAIANHLNRMHAMDMKNERMNATFGLTPNSTVVVKQGELTPTGSGSIKLPDLPEGADMGVYGGISIGDGPPSESTVYIQTESKVAGDTLRISMSKADVKVKETRFVLKDTGAVSTVEMNKGSVEFISRATGKRVTVSAGEKVSATDAGLGNVEKLDDAAAAADWAKAEAEAGFKPEGSKSWLSFIPGCSLLPAAR